MSFLSRLTGIDIDLNPFDRGEALEIDLLGGGKKSTSVPAAASNAAAANAASDQSAAASGAGSGAGTVSSTNDGLMAGQVGSSTPAPNANELLMLDLLGQTQGNQAGLATGQGNILASQAGLASGQDNLALGQQGISDAIGSAATTVDFTNAMGQPFTPEMGDVLQTLKIIDGSVDPSRTDIGMYDVNNDGAIDVADSNLMLQSITGQNPQSTAATGLYGQFADQNKMLTDRFDTAISDIGTANTALSGLGTDVSALGTNLGTIGTGLGTLQGDVTQGFADTAQGFVDQGKRFSDLDTSVGNVQGAVDTGFSNQQTNFDNRTDALNEAFGNIDTNADARVSTLQDAVIQGQAGLGDRFSDVSGAVGTVGDNLNAYAGQLLENQGIMTDDQGNFQTNFGEFIDRYGTDTTRADQARADLQTGQGNILDQAVANQIAIANAQAAQQGSAAAQDAQGKSIQNVLEQGFSDQSQANSLTQGQLDSLASATGETQGLLSQGFSDLQNQGNVLADQISTTDDNTQAILAAFDAQGNLKRSEVRADGTLVGRNLDANGLLIESNYSPRGELLNTNVFDTKMLGGDITGIMSQAA